MTTQQHDPDTPGWAVRLETKVDMLLKKDDDHETRIRKLEKWQYVATGLAAAAGSGVGATLARVLGG